MPFGLNVAPRVFTKLLKPVVAWLRGQGIRLIIYLDDIQIMASSVELVKQTQTNNYSPSGIIRVPDKLQVNVNPNSKDSIPRVVDRFDTNVVHSARNKNHVNSQSMSTACQQTTTNYSRSLTGTRPTRILPTGSVVSTVTLSSASRTSNKFTETVVRLRPTNTSDTSSQVGLIMVDKQSTLVERQSNTTSNYRYYDNIVIVITITYVASKMGWGASMGTLTTGGKWSQVEAQEPVK